MNVWWSLFEHLLSGFGSRLGVGAFSMRRSPSEEGARRWPGATCFLFLTLVLACSAKASESVTEGTRIARVVHVFPLFRLSNDQNIALKDQMKGAIEVLATAKVDLEFVMHEPVTFEDGVVDVGECSESPLTVQQSRMFALAANVEGHEIVAFAAQNLGANGVGGCARHPPGRPGCVISITDSRMPAYVLAHELGHVFGLPDRETAVRVWLMYKHLDWSQDPPWLDDAEKRALEQGTKLVSMETPLAKSATAERIVLELNAITPRWALITSNQDIAEPIVREYLSSEKPALRARAVYALSLLKKSPGVENDLLEAARSLDPEKRRAVAYAVRNLDLETARKATEVLLSSDDPSAIKGVLSSSTPALLKAFRPRIESLLDKQNPTWMREYIDGSLK